MNIFLINLSRRDPALAVGGLLAVVVAGAAAVSSHQQGRRSSLRLTLSPLSGLSRWEGRVYNAWASR
jgi:hypothetical protein